MKKQINTPLLRFPNFKNEWSVKKFGELTKRASNPVKVEEHTMYQQIGIRSHGKGIFHKELVSGKTLGNKRVFWVKKDALTVNIVFAWEQAIAKTSEKELGMIASHRFPMYLPIENQSNLDYLMYFFLTPKGKSLMELASPGGAGRNKTLGQKELENTKFLIPKIEEQKKIAEFISSIEKRLTLLKQKNIFLKQYKKGISQKVFSKKLRFKDKGGKEFKKWIKQRLGDCLSYEQPTKYLVSTKDYNDSFKTPVLTAGKTFILGYTSETENIFKKNLPVIIFDDFTTASKYVDFPFKVKSSAMKILNVNDNKKINIKYIFEYIQNIKHEIGSHGRHWISVFSEMQIEIPCPEEQAKIADFFFAIDKEIEYSQIQIDEMEHWKKGVLQKIFC